MQSGEPAGSGPVNTPQTVLSPYNLTVFVETHEGCQVNSSPSINQCPNVHAKCWHNMWNCSGLSGPLWTVKLSSFNSGISFYSEKCTVLREASDWIESEVSWERFILARVLYNMPCCTGATIARSFGSQPPNYRSPRSDDVCLSARPA